MVLAYLVGIPAALIGGKYLYDTFIAPISETETKGETIPSYPEQPLLPEELKSEAERIGGRFGKGLGYSYGLKNLPESEKIRRRHQELREMYKGSWQEILAMTPRTESEREAQESLKTAMSGFYSPEATAYMVDEYRKMKLGLGEERFKALQEALKTGVGVEGGVVRTAEGYKTKFGYVPEAEGRKIEQAEELIRQFKAGKVVLETEAQKKGRPTISVQELKSAEQTLQKYRAETQTSAVRIDKDIAINRATGRVMQFVPNPAGTTYHGGVRGRWETVQAGLRGAIVGTSAPRNIPLTIGGVTYRVSEATKRKYETLLKKGYSKQEALKKAR